MRYSLNKMTFVGLALILFFFVMPACAQDSNNTLQAIILKDGTVLKGRIIEVRNGYYQIQTNLTGAVQVHETDIVSINNIQNSPPQNPVSSLQNKPSGLNVSPLNSGQDLKSKLGALSENLLADPEIHAAIQELSQDPEIMQTLGNQDLLNAVLSMNPATMQNNAGIQQLIGNPKMQRLMEMISQKLLSSSAINLAPSDIKP